MDVEFVKYQFEDGKAGVVIKSGFKIGVRHLQLLYMLVCSSVMGAMRGSTAVAILAINDVTRRNDTYIQIHSWDRRIQGTVLSFFFFGYALMLIPAELTLRKVNSKLVLTVVLVVNGALSVAMPTIVNRGGWVAVSNAQFLMGMTHACVSPANKSLLARWLPPSERGIFSMIVYGGVFLGTVIALPISGMLSEAKLGWELIFYTQAMMALSMATVWSLLTASSPEKHQAIGDKEKEFIEESLRFYHKKYLHKPWHSILRSPRFWAVACAHAASNAIFIFYITDVPLYLQAFGTSLKDSARQSIFPIIAMWAMYWFTAPAIDWLCKIGLISFVINITYFRKLINALGAFGSTVGLATLSALMLDSNYALAILTATLALLGFQFSGFLESLKDMSQNHSGILLMLSSTIASFIGALTPVVSALILGDDVTDLKRWRIVLLTLASLCIICNIVYTALGSSERQDWDNAEVKIKFAYHNKMNDSNQLELEELGQSKILREKYETDTAV